MPPNVSNATCTNILSDMPFAHFLYKDDLIVGSKCKEDHVRDLQCLFQRLKDKGLLLNKNKCQLGEPSLTFLGHVVDSRGISIPTERVEAITRFPVPTTPKEPERFFGNLCMFPPLCKKRVWENGTAKSTQEHIPPKRLRRGLESGP